MKKILARAVLVMVPIAAFIGGLALTVPEDQDLPGSAFGSEADEPTLSSEAIGPISTTTTTTPAAEPDLPEPTADINARFEFDNPVDRQFNLDPPGDWIVAKDDFVQPETVVARLRRLGDANLADQVATEVERPRRGGLELLLINGLSGDVIAVEALTVFETPMDVVADFLAEADYRSGTVSRATLSGADVWYVEGGTDEPVSLVTRTNPVTAMVITYPRSSAGTVTDNLQLEVLVDAPDH